MNKEIKFRAWDKTKSKMFYFSFREIHYNGILEGTDLDNCKIMEYTGLKDINGKEIYEGDIVIGRILEEVEGVTYRISQDTFTVKWENLLAGFNLAEYDSFEVLGNIYENLEKIKE